MNSLQRLGASVSKTAVATAGLLLLSACGGDDKDEQKGESSTTKDIAARILILPRENASTPLTVYRRDVNDTATTQWISDEQLLELEDIPDRKIGSIFIGNTLIIEPPEDLYLQLDERGAPLYAQAQLPEEQEYLCSFPDYLTQVALDTSAIGDDISPIRLWHTNGYVDSSAGRQYDFVNLCQNGVLVYNPMLWIDAELGRYIHLPGDELYNMSEGEVVVLPEPTLMPIAQIDSNLTGISGIHSTSLTPLVGDAPQDYDFGVEHDDSLYRVGDTVERSSETAWLELPYLPSATSRSNITYLLNYSFSTEIPAPVVSWPEFFPGSIDENVLLTTSTQSMVAESELQAGIHYQFPPSPFGDEGLMGGHGFIFFNPDSSGEYSLPVGTDLLVVKALVKNSIHAKEDEDWTEVTAIAPIRGRTQLDGFGPYQLTELGDSVQIVSTSVVRYSTSYNYRTALAQWSQGSLDYISYSLTPLPSDGAEQQARDSEN